MTGLLTDAQLTSITATVTSSLDKSLPVYRKSTASDGYGHSTETWTSVGPFNVNVFRLTATQLQAYAGIIGAQQAFMIRFMATSDIREGDRVIYNSKNWLVQNSQTADESYTVDSRALITEVQ